MPNNKQTPDFSERIKHALADRQLRLNFRGAMDFLRAKRNAAFNDETEWQKLRKDGAKIRNDVIEHLPELLEQLEQQCTRNGIHVHWAEDSAEANQIILNIAKEKHAKRVVKGKSMASEEIEMNAFLAKHDIDCIESDMGEYIVQLANETPSHIIMPAIHKNKAEIAQLFEQKLAYLFPDGLRCSENDVDGMIGLGRKVLREKFEHADIGVSGVNFAIADTGTLCLVENEGNGRLSTTAPATHIALMGLEKVIPNINVLPTLQRLLTRSATGQHVTTYLNLISGPRKPTELDGPQEVHLILLDNGRSIIKQDDDLKTTLACIRCGACMNHCPVYTRIGGHAYGTTYPGPIGQIITPQLKGMSETGDLLDACSLNGACGEACPVEIDLPKLIRTLRSKRAERPPRNSLEYFIWLGWRIVHTHPRLYRFSTKLFARNKLRERLIPKAWTQSRHSPTPAEKSLHQQLREQSKS